jgi:hypothetical protein
VLSCTPSWGRWFIASMFLGVVLYLGFGVAINWKCKGRNLGKEALPHLEFWVASRALCIDGVCWSLSLADLKVLPRSVGGGHSSDQLDKPLAPPPNHGLLPDRAPDSGEISAPVDRHGDRATFCTGGDGGGGGGGGPPRLSLPDSARLVGIGDGGGSSEMGGGGAKLSPAKTEKKEKRKRVREKDKATPQSLPQAMPRPSMSAHDAEQFGVGNFVE